MVSPLSSRGDAIRCGCSRRAAMTQFCQPQQASTSMEISIQLPLHLSGRSVPGSVSDQQSCVVVSPASAAVSSLLHCIHSRLWSETPRQSASLPTMYITPELFLPLQQEGTNYELYRRVDDIMSRDLSPENEALGKRKRGGEETGQTPR